ncbi:hypothetical protein BGW38_000097 [Lunasporangiospora selenospora]|uniref:Uncharacterized protein n=1 Tax=Lunasporangiospora selenospora TaxID=979761 RepID=A0A9P6G1S8_9FUNG|nr:hypothetical protein BGW38_000097 [Lunasporangiospora selenospora]
MVPAPRKAINIYHNDSEQKDGPRVAASIVDYAISASGSHTATLSSSGRRLHLDVWDLDLKNGTQPSTDSTLSTHHTTSTAHYLVDYGEEENRNYRLSISWDGSQIAVNENNIALERPVKLFTFKNPRANDQSSLQESRKRTILQPSTRHSRCTRLNLFKGYARFTHIATEEWSDKSERYVAYNGKELHVFTTSEEWEMLYNIQISPVVDWERMRWTFLNMTQGIIAAWQSPLRLSIWCMVSGKRLCNIDTVHRIERFALSSDGCAIAISTIDALFLYSAISGMFIQKIDVSYENWAGYLETENRIYLWKREANPTNSNSGQFKIHLPYRSMTKIHHTYPGKKYLSVNTGSAIITSCHGSTLEVSLVEDFSHDLDDMAQRKCECVSGHHQLPEIKKEMSLSFSNGVYSMRTRDGLGGQPGQGDFQKLMVTTQFKDGRSSQVSLEAERFYSVQEHSQIVALGSVKDAIRLSVWRLPQMPGDDLEPLSYWELSRPTHCLGSRVTPDSSTADRTSVSIDRMLNSIHKKYWECSIRYSPYWGSLRLFSNNKEVDLYLANVLTPGTANKFLYTAVDMFYKNRAKVQNAREGLIRYLRRHVNYYPDPDDHSKSVMSSLCKEWTAQNHPQFMNTLSRLLEPHTEHNWLPRLWYSKGSNPVGIMLQKALVEPGALEIIRILTNYCINRAKNKIDISYIMFLLECQEDLAYQYPDVGLATSRVFAYFKQGDRDLIVNNYRIVQRHTRIHLWVRDARKIYECKNPILQLNYTGQEPDTRNTGFTEEVHIAPVNLLWSFIPNSQCSASEFSSTNCKLDKAWPQVGLIHLKTIADGLVVAHLIKKTLRLYQLSGAGLS